MGGRQAEGSERDAVYRNGSGSAPVRAQGRERNAVSVLGEKTERGCSDEGGEKEGAFGKIRAEGKNLKIVYTPLHGTGNIPARREMEEIGFTHVYVVPEQELPDGDFMFTAGYSDKENLFCWILSLGDQIELLEPCEFRGELAELGRRVYEIYR